MTSMRATFTHEQEMLAATALDMASAGLEDARALLEGNARSAEPTQSLFDGFAALAIPEEVGGAGGGLVELVVLAEGLARQVTPTPFLTHVVAVQIARGAGIELDDDVVNGRRRLVAAVNPLPVRDGDLMLSSSGAEGVVRAVPDGVDAHHVVVVDAHGRAALGEVIDSTPRPGLDCTRPLADVRVRALGDVVPVGTGLLRGAVVAAGDLIGAGRGAVRLAAAYASQREQFGQPIGKFQGVAHPLAEAEAGLETAWSLALYAGWALDAGADDAVETAHSAKARAGQAAIFAAERGLQTHGGIGMTWEADPHLYLRRVLAVDGWLGGRTEHRRQLGARLLGARA